MNIIEETINERIRTLQTEVDLLTATINHDRANVESIINRYEAMKNERQGYIEYIKELKKHLEGLK
jgi:ABC-type transporter Mla maintaining outer membrane lipid asymmetry ATPase subunit MlaF